MTSRKLPLTTAIATVSLAATLAASLACATTYSITTIATRPGITVPLMIIDKHADSPAARGTLIMFTGSGGQLHLLTNWPTDQAGLITHDTDSASNFLVRQRNNFAATGFNVILMDVPSDQANGYDTSPSFRKSKNHQTDIAGVIAYARQQFGVPVWVVGTSRGSTSAVKAALIAAQRPALEGPAGFVLTSTIVASSDYDDVLAMNLNDIGLVGMMVANEGDICSVTPPSGVNQIARHLLASPDFRAKFLTNTTAPVDPADACGPTGYHGFSHAEGSVVTPVTGWILSHLP